MNRSLFGIKNSLRLITITGLLIASVFSCKPFNARPTAIKVDVWNRIISRLEAIAERWERAPKPVVMPSGKSPEEIISSASANEILDSSRFIWRLALTSVAERQRVFARERLRRSLTEVDLWLPLFIADREQLRDIESAGLIIYAWLQLAESLGRRDIVMFAASFAFDVSRLRTPTQRLFPAAQQWTSLPIPAHSSRAAARIHRAYATIAFELGKSQAALAAYRQTRALFATADNRAEVGYSWRGEAEILFRLGQNQAALTANQRARALFKKLGDKLGMADSYLGEARILFRRSQYQAALNTYVHARSLFKEAGIKLSEGETWLGEAEILFRLGQDIFALAAYRRARTLFNNFDARRGQGRSLRGEAQVLLRRGHYQSALVAASAAETLFLREQDTAGLYNTYLLLAHILTEEGRDAEVMRYAERARQLLQRLRAQRGGDIDRLTVSESSSPYDILIPRLAASAADHPLTLAKALALAEEAHAPVLLDLIVGRVRSRANDGNASQAALRMQLVQEQHTLESQRDKLERALDQSSAHPQHALRARLAELDVAMLAHELATRGAEGTQLLSATPIDERVQEQLIHDVGPVLMYYVAAQETIGFLLRPGHPPMMERIALSRAELHEHVEKLRHALANPRWLARADDRRRSLYQQLVAPFASELEQSERLTIIPHGPLHELPFAALLIDAETPLFERWHLSFTPSMSALNSLRAHREARQGTAGERIFLGIAGGKGLIMPASAVTNIGAHFGPAAKIVSPGPGSREVYREQAGQARHLLLATHGTHEPQSHFGYLELAARAGHSIRLTAFEIARTPIAAELVTLAACDSARGEALLNDERLDLTRAFLIAGASAVLATRWQIADHPDTQRFLLDFYSAVNAGMRKDEALTHARRKARSRSRAAGRDDAQLWAAWVLVGDAR